MKNLIVNADDFGYSKAVNLGIAEGHINGIVTSTTLMANMPGVEHAVKLSSNMPNLGVGVHLTLTCGKPLLKEKVKSLVNENGYFYKLKDYEINKELINKEELYAEWKAQINKLYSYGVKITHIDSHHHVHSFKENVEVVKRLSNEFKLPIRNCEKEKNNTQINFLDLFNYPEIRDMSLNYHNNKDIFFKIIEELIKSNIQFSKTEVMCHPAYLDSFLFENSSFNIARIREVDLLCDPKMKKLINKYGINLKNYKTI